MIDKKINKKINKDQILVVRGSRDQGLTPRGRIMVSPREQIVRFKHPNKYYNIILKHTAGPMKGVVINFSKVLCRKAKTSLVCNCEAYNYPHAKGRGQCQTKA